MHRLRGIHPATLKYPVTKAFQELFGADIDASGWAEDKFYIIRAVVNEKMPHASADAARQNDLMRLRENMVIPLITLWCVALAFAFEKGRSQAWLGLTIGIISTISAYWAAGRLAGRAADNRAREVREICTAFVVGARLGLFAPIPQRSSELPSSPPEGRQMIVPSEIGKDVLPIRAPTSGSA